MVKSGNKQTKHNTFYVHPSFHTVSKSYHEKDEIEMELYPIWMHVFLDNAYEPKQSKQKIRKIKRRV